MDEETDSSTVRHAEGSALLADRRLLISGNQVIHWMLLQ